MLANAQRLSVRVYYEDTDFSGRVYHASYFRFFERGRTEWLRTIGFSHSDLANADGVAFAVTRLQAEFHAGAAIDDLLEIVTQVEGTRGAVLKFNQRAVRDGVALVTAAVDVVAIRNNRAVRLPKEIREALGA